MLAWLVFIFGVARIRLKQNQLWDVEEQRVPSCWGFFFRKFNDKKVKQVHQQTAVVS